MMFGFLFGKNNIKTISPKEAKEKLAQNNKNLYLIDVRTPEEYHEVHIPKSISLPLDNLPSTVSKIVADKNAEIIVYCLSGSRASAACKQLAALGYTNVWNLGGIHSWTYETVRGNH